MSILALIVGIVLWIVGAGTLATIGEVITIVAGIVIALQAALFVLFAAIAVESGSSFPQKFI